VEYRDNFEAYKKKVKKLTIQSVESLWWVNNVYLWESKFMLL
jgi:hypothetical protein